MSRFLSARADGAMSSEMVSLSERLSRMLLVRIGCVVVVFASHLFSVRMAETGVNLPLLSALYIFLAFAIEGLRRWSGGRGLLLIGMMLLVDGIYLAWTTYASGGAESPLRILLYVHLISVTLLASYRTGLKIALWHSLLLFVGFYSQLAGFIERVGQKWEGPNVTGQFHRASVYNVTAFWAVAVGTALCSALNERELRRRGVDLEVLAEMATELDSASDTEGAAHCLVTATSEAFRFRRSAILIDVGDRISIPAHEGCEEIPANVERLDRLIDDAWRERRSILVEEFDHDSNPQLATLFPNASRLVIVPLIAEGSRMGALVAEQSGRRRYRIDSRALAMLDQFAVHGALALTNVRLLEQVQKLAETDALTGVWNRMMFDRVLEKEIARSSRTGAPFSLVMIDLDHFKKLNDRLGHQGGDEVLKQVANALVDNARDFDTVARYGGEEFAMIVPEIEARDASLVAERLRSTIENLPTPVPLTASLGVASHPAGGATADLVLRAADEALYASKREGRNRVTTNLGAGLDIFLGVPE